MMTAAGEGGRTDAAVARLGLMDTAPEERYDRITRLAQETFGVRHAVMNLVDSSTVYTKSQIETDDFVHTPLEESFCAETVKGDGILEVPDGRADPRFAGRGIVVDSGMRFYAGLPLRTEDGAPVATLCLLDEDPHRLSADERAAFERFGQWAQAEIRADDPATDAAAEEDGTTAADPGDGAAAGTPARLDWNDDDLSLAALAIPYESLGGDRSAWHRTGDVTIVTLADVMGKGARAHELARILVAELYAHTDLAPLEAVEAAEAAVAADPAFADTFATLFHAALDTATGRVAYVDAGHGLTLHLAADGTATRLSSHNLPLGLRPDGLEWESGELVVASGDLIVSVSDGVLDAYDSTLDSLRRVGEDLRRAADADAFFDGLSLRVSTHTVGDDVTALVVFVH